MKYLTFLVFFVIFVVALLFSIRNLDPVPIDFYYFKIDLPLALIMTLELLAGVVIGLSVGFARNIRLRAEISKASKKLLVTERELAELRSAVNEN